MKKLAAMFVALFALNGAAESYAIVFGIDAQKKKRQLFKIDLESLEVEKIDSSPNLELGDYVFLREHDGKVYVLAQDQKKVIVLDARQNFIWERTTKLDAQPSDMAFDDRSAYIALPSRQAIDQMDLQTARIERRVSMPTQSGPNWQFSPQYISVFGSMLVATSEQKLEFPHTALTQINLQSNEMKLAYAFPTNDANLLVRGEALVLAYSDAQLPWILGELPLTPWSTLQKNIPGIGNIDIIQDQTPLVQRFTSALEVVEAMDCAAPCNDVFAVVNQRPAPGSTKTKLTFERLDLLSGERHELYSVSGELYGITGGYKFPHAEYFEIFHELEDVKVDPVTKRLVVLENSDQGHGIHVFQADGTNLGLVDLGEGFEPFSMTVVEAPKSDRRLAGELTMKVYPNPAVEGQEVTVHIETTRERICSIKAYNSLGQEASLEAKIIKLHERETAFSFNPAALRWSAGTYALALNCNQGRAAAKMVYVHE